MSVPELVREALRDHPEGLTMSQVNDIVRPVKPDADTGTALYRMGGKGEVLTSGPKGSTIYKLNPSFGRESEADGGEGNDGGTVNG
ncbi:MAG: hypothetical protein QM820_54140 [Minicystis sp.]